MPENTIKLEGMKELKAAMIDLEKAMGDPDGVEAILKEGTDIIAEDMRRRVHVGKGHVKNGQVLHVRNSIISKILKRRGNTPAPAIAGVDYKKAPHAVILEYSKEQPRVQKKTGRKTGVMPRMPFIRPAWDDTKEIAYRHIVARLRERVEKVGK